jgi:hypothetical protein
VTSGQPRQDCLAGNPHVSTTIINYKDKTARTVLYSNCGIVEQNNRDRTILTIGYCCQHCDDMTAMTTVPDRRSRDHEVVVVRRTINPGGRDFGMGREWGEDGSREISLWATWDQGGRDPTTARRVPSKWREMEGRAQRESERVSKKQGDCAVITLSVYMHVHNDCL